jgi:hypothetical protein
MKPLANHATADNREQTEQDGETAECNGRISEYGCPATQQWIIDWHMSALPEAGKELMGGHLCSQPTGGFVEPDRARIDEDTPCRQRAHPDEKYEDEKIGRTSIDAEAFFHKFHSGQLFSRTHSTYVGN